MKEKTITLTMPADEFMNLSAYLGEHVMGYVKDPPKELIEYLLKYSSPGFSCLKLNDNIINTAIQTILESKHNSFPPTEKLINTLSLALKRQKKTTSLKEATKKTTH